MKTLEIIYQDYLRYVQIENALPIKPPRRWIEFGSYKKRGNWLLWNAIICRNHRFAFTYWLRILSNTDSSVPKILRLVARYKYRSLMRMFGLHIPYSTKIGAGLYIGHGIGIVVNPTAILGKNCNISQFVTIGSNKGKAATIGDNVYIGPSVCIVEDVRIGSNVKIGAGSVVINNVPDNSTTVGNPNRIITK